MSKVYLIDDDEDIRQYIATILQSMKISVIQFSSAAEFLQNYSNEMCGCILSDVLMPDMDGLALQNELLTRQITLPLILMSGHGDIGIVKAALKKGAVDFLEKPLDIKELVDVIKQGVSIAESRNHIDTEQQLLRQKIESLTERENQILEYLVAGNNNKAIAKLLHISTRTVETHRNRILKKMQFTSFQDFIHFSHKISFFD